MPALYRAYDNSVSGIPINQQCVLLLLRLARIQLKEPSKGSRCSSGIVPRRSYLGSSAKRDHPHRSRVLELSSSLAPRRVRPLLSPSRTSLNPIAVSTSVWVWYDMFSARLLVEFGRRYPRTEWDVQRQRVFALLVEYLTAEQLGGRTVFSWREKEVHERGLGEGRVRFVFLGSEVAKDAFADASPFF